MVDQPAGGARQGRADDRDGVAGRLRAAGCVFAEEEARLLRDAARTPAELEEMISRRSSGMPIEHVVGWAEFCGLRVSVGPGVFVPRRRTEFLVRQAVAFAQASALAKGRPDGRITVLDMCCGSGAIGLALAAMLGPIALHATDIDPVAVACARRNLAAIAGHVFQGDLYVPLPGHLRGRVQILIANVPYVPSGDIAMLPSEARNYERRAALDGGTDGLDVLRRVCAGASRWLAPGGALLTETSERQLQPAGELLAAGGLAVRAMTSSEGEASVLVATKPPPAGAQ